MWNIKELSKITMEALQKLHPSFHTVKSIGIIKDEMVGTFSMYRKVWLLEVKGRNYVGTDRKIILKRVLGKGIS
jgi:hypothetical protein